MRGGGGGRPEEAGREEGSLPGRRPGPRCGAGARLTQQQQLDILGSADPVLLEVLLDRFAPLQGCSFLRAQGTSHGGQATSAGSAPLSDAPRAGKAKRRTRPTPTRSGTAGRPPEISKRAAAGAERTPGGTTAPRAGLPRASRRINASESKPGGCGAAGTGGCAGAEPGRRRRRVGGGWVLVLLLLLPAGSL